MAELVCLPVTGPDDERVPGSQVRWCHLCAAELWVAPSGLTLIEVEDAQPLCMACAMSLIEEGDELLPVPGSDESLRAQGFTDEEIDSSFRLATMILRGGL